ncbi:H-NS histone family protein [Paraburkholderia sp. BL6669N2]|uniref:H-NS histone family protein n=1 Tax=Paraburkholderia sp. BL6669N2 TaxID=1938807 RepID=UPI000E27C789|nr:H-NS histone family protein [Paraburkholderia sp. BL6669N2]REG50971.1 H-NS histone family protein [Paraburkholderia sp. BL6669N2]
MGSYCADFGFTATDIFGGRRLKRSPTTSLFRNPETGATWSGRGREPHWIEGKDREAFRISALIVVVGLTLAQLTMKPSRPRFLLLKRGARAQIGKSPSPYGLGGESQIRHVGR